jgi:hypothetical protein
MPFCQLDNRGYSAAIPYPSSVHRPEVTGQRSEPACRVFASAALAS